MNGIRALVVDDEKPARARLVELLAKSPQVGVVGECANGREAVRRIEEDGPDVVFLDVQMPELDGFGVLREVGAGRAPVVVFVTAYDQFALRAFENNALDYLLKPFSDERFELCLERAIEHVRMRERSDLSARLEQLLNAWRPGADRGHAAAHRAATQTDRGSAVAPGAGSQPDRGSAAAHGAGPQPDRLAIRGGGRVLFLNVDEIVWIEAAGVYVDLHTAHKTHLHRATLGDLEARLDPAQFVRIHRSTIVNLRHVRELHPQAHGDGTVILDDRTELKLSRSYRARLEQCLGQPL